MKKPLVALLASLTGVAGLLAFCADIPTVSSGPITVTSAVNVPVTPLNLSGQSTCAMTLSGAGSATITPNGSGDGGQTFIAGTPQSSNGTYVVPIGANITNFYVAVTSVTGTVTVTAVCSATVGSTSGGGSTNTNATIVAPTTGAGAVLVHPDSSALPTGPLPTATAGVAPPTSLAQIATFPSCYQALTNQVAVTAGNAFTCRMDNRGHIQVELCGNNANQCISNVQGQANTLSVFTGAITENQTVTTTACTSVAQSQTILVHVTYPATSGTGILSIYNESSVTPSCAAADLVYTTNAAVTTPQQIPWTFVLSAGLAYKWSAGPTNAAYIGTI